MVIFENKISYANPPDLSKLPKLYLNERERYVIEIFMIPENYIYDFISITRIQDIKTKLFFLEHSLKKNHPRCLKYVEKIWDLLGYNKYLYDENMNCYNIFDNN